MRMTIFALLTAAALAQPFGPALAQDNTVRPDQRLISVTGQGVVHARPDMAIITVGMVSEAESAREALSENTATMTGLIDALKAAGIDPNDLQTSNFSVSPVYSQPPYNQDPNQLFVPEILRYSVRNDLTVRIRDLATTGAILDQVVTLGANSINGPTFTVDDSAAIENQARRAAMRDAIERGQLYAAAVNVSLGPIYRIEEGYAQGPQPLPYAAMAREQAADASVPIEGGELEFSAQVSVSWIIGQ